MSTYVTPMIYFLKMHSYSSASILHNLCVYLSLLAQLSVIILTRKKKNFCSLEVWMPNFVCQSIISLHIFYVYYSLDQMNTANAIKKGLGMRIAHLECSNRKLEENLKECNAKNELMTNEKEVVKVRFY